MTDRDFTRRRPRTALYAAFTWDRMPVFGVWGWYAKDVDARIAERKANREAYHGEHRVRITTKYNDVLAQHGFPTVLFK